MLDSIVKAWRGFLDSLATPGGDLFLLAAFAGLFALMTVAVSVWMPHDQAAFEVANTAMAGFTGALLRALKGG